MIPLNFLAYVVVPSCCSCYWHSLGFQNMCHNCPTTGLNIVSSMAYIIDHIKEIQNMPKITNLYITLLLTKKPYTSCRQNACALNRVCTMSWILICSHTWSPYQISLDHCWPNNDPLRVSWFLNDALFEKIFWLFVYIKRRKDNRSWSYILCASKGMCLQHDFCDFQEIYESEMWDMQVDGSLISAW